MSHIEPLESILLRAEKYREILNGRRISDVHLLEALAVAVRLADELKTYRKTTLKNIAELPVGASTGWVGARDEMAAGMGLQIEAGGSPQFKD